MKNLAKHAATEAGFSSSEVDDFSAHSIRVGAAQDLLCAGFHTAAIMRARGWKSVNVLSSYLEKAEHIVWAWKKSTDHGFRISKANSFAVGFRAKSPYQVASGSRYPSTSSIRLLEPSSISSGSSSGPKNCAFAISRLLGVSISCPRTSQR